MTNYELKDGKILTNSAEIEIYGEYDVVVVGGGMAGVGAAVSAAIVTVFSSMSGVIVRSEI